MVYTILAARREKHQFVINLEKGLKCAQEFVNLLIMVGTVVRAIEHRTLISAVMREKS